MCVPSEMCQMGTHRQQRQCKKKCIPTAPSVVQCNNNLSLVRSIRNVMPCRWHCEFIYVYFTEKVTMRYRSSISK